MRLTIGSKPYLFMAAMLAAGTVHAQIPVDNPGCHTPVANSEFKLTTVVARGLGIDEPIKMAFDTDALGNVDIFWVERLGKVKKFLGATKTVMEVGSVDYYPGYEDGLTGIVLDPAYKTNHMIYLYYSQGTDKDFHFRVSRFTLDAQGKMDPASEKVILAIPAIASHMHTGGAMVFDAKGDLWVTVGENQSGEEGPGNTNDLRGKILRIHPNADGTYSVPDGNLFPAGTAKTKPEIYVMGCRNPYSLSLDPVRKGITWGDIGPDGVGITEEHNYTTKPGNFGWPYYAGNNVKLMGTGTPEAPINNNSKTGLVNLPPATPAIDSYKQLAAITGPIYRYNSIPNSPVKFPPQFDGLWFVTDFQEGIMDTISMNAAGTAMIAKGVIFPGMHFDRPIDMKMGPDGAMYVINYAGWFGPATTTSIQRIEYTGTCRPAVVTAIAPGNGPVTGSEKDHGLRASGMMVEVEGSGDHVLRIGDLRGRALATFTGSGPGRYDLSEKVGNRAGLYTARLTSGRNTVSKTVFLGAGK